MSTQGNITIKGARVHNLKNIDVEIPRNKLVVIKGLSGSGKTDRSAYLPKAIKVFVKAFNPATQVFSFAVLFCCLDLNWRTLF